MSTTTVIYHKSDYDGILCREIAKRFLKPIPTLIGWEYGDPEPEVGPGLIYILDLSVDSLMSKPELRDRIVWIDHHKTAIEKYAGVPFAGYQIDGVAACRLAWQYFGSLGLPRLGITETMILPLKQHFVDRMVLEPELVRLAGEYDIWDHRDPRAATLQLGLRAIRPEEFDSVMDALLRHQPCQQTLGSVLEDGQKIQSFVDAGAKELMEISHLVHWAGLRFRVCNGPRGSLAFKSVTGQGEDALMSWRFDGVRGQVKVSLYHTPGREDLDLSAIAKRHGGGGHRGACGFEVSLVTMAEILGSARFKGPGFKSEQPTVVLKTRCTGCQEPVKCEWPETMSFGGVVMPAREAMAAALNNPSCEILCDSCLQKRPDVRVEDLQAGDKP